MSQRNDRAGEKRSGWTRSNIKCLPFVTSEYVDRKTGETRRKDVEQMLREFKRRVQKSHVLEEYKARQSFVSPSQKRRAARKNAAHKRRSRR